MEHKQMTVEELERIGTTVSVPELQQTLDLVRKYDSRFYVVEETHEVRVPVRMLGVVWKYRTANKTTYTIWRVGKKGASFPIKHRSADGSRYTAVSADSAMDWLGGWIFNEAPRHKQ